MKHKPNLIRKSLERSDLGIWLFRSVLAKRIFIFLFTFSLLLLPFAFSYALEGPLIPCDGSVESPCDFEQLMKLVANVIDFLLKDMVLPIFAILCAYIGFLYLTSGANPGNRDTAKKMFPKIVIGFLVALAAWLIVKIILITLGYDGGVFPQIIGN